MGGVNSKKTLCAVICEGKSHTNDRTSEPYTAAWAQTESGVWFSTSQLGRGVPLGSRIGMGGTSSNLAVFNAQTGKEGVFV